MTLPLPNDRPYGPGLLLGGSLQVLWQQRRALLRAAALPLALLLLPWLLDDRAPLQADLAPSEDAVADQAEGEGGAVATLLFLLLDLLAFTLFSVAWYRFLLGYGAPTLWPRLSRAHLRFLGRALLLALLPLAPLLLLDTLPFPPLLAVAVLPLLYLSLRWSLALPAAAVDVRLTFRQSWRATAGKVPPLALASILGPVAIAFIVAPPFFLLAGLSLDANEPRPGPFAALVLWLEWAIFILLTIAQSSVVLALAAVRLAPDPRNA